MREGDGMCLLHLNTANRTAIGMGLFDALSESERPMLATQSAPAGGDDLLIGRHCTTSGTEQH